jgi:hypothetical protein
MLGQKVSTVKVPMFCSNEDELDSGVMDKPCAMCCSTGNKDDCLLCSTCNKAMHYSCVDLSSFPAGDDWACPLCVKNTAVASLKVAKIAPLNPL